ncbi:hypothetical protein V8C86DRAFT_3092886 [Haematococcus lacustris]
MAPLAQLVTAIPADHANLADVQCGLAVVADWSSAATSLRPTSGAGAAGTQRWSPGLEQGRWAQGQASSWASGAAAAEAPDAAKDPGLRFLVSLPGRTRTAGYLNVRLKS